MPYSPVFSNDFNETLVKLKKKDNPLFEALNKKIREILNNPEHYKPLRNALKGCRGVHVGHFVLLFEISETEKSVIFLKFEHHDTAYK
ncbi:MAG: type II toxin-antitoxin system RelE/ParE family toxin [Candidatus Methanoperedens sp.]